MYLFGEWGVNAPGPAVFPMFLDTLHVGSFHAIPRRPIIRGWDPGWTHAACVWIQSDALGRWVVLHELLGEQEDARTFVQRAVAEGKEHFPDAPFEDYCDVAGTQHHSSETTFVSILRNPPFSFTVHTRKLDLAKSIQGVRDLLGTLTDGAVPMLRIDARCRRLVRALAGGYHIDPKRNEPKKDGTYDHLCLAGDTPVRTLHAGWQPICTLVGRDFWTYAYDGRRLIPARATQVTQTAAAAEVWRLTCEDGTVLRATPEHPIMRRDGTYCALRDLVPGDRLMPCYDTQNRRGYTTVNLNDGSIAYEHRYVYAWFHGPLLPSHHVHHVDRDRQNNAPENLDQLAETAHMAEVYARMRRADCPTKTNGSTNPWHPVTRAKVSMWSRAWAKANRVATLCAHCGSAYMRLNRTGVTQFCSRVCWEKARGSLQATNHVVARVAPDGVEPVFNLAIDGPPNFPANRIMVHNCDALRYGLAPAVLPLRSVYEGRPLPRWRIPA